jgi:hypothetical protein
MVTETNDQEIFEVGIVLMFIGQPYNGLRGPIVRVKRYQESSGAWRTRYVIKIEQPAMLLEADSSFFDKETK